MRTKSMFLFFGLFLFLFGCGGGGGGPEPVKNTSIPYVKSFTPGNGFTNVATNTVIEVVFSEPINPDSVNAANFDVRSSGHAIAATYVVSDGNTKVTIKPNGDLAVKTTYTTKVKDVKSASGVTSATQSWSFTTDVTSFDVTPPTITAFAPGSGEVNVKLDAVVTVTFSETVDPATINTTNIKLCKGDDSVEVSLTVVGAEVTIKPKTLLATSTYTPSIKDVKDLAGNTMTTKSGWNFSTGTASGSGLSDDSVPAAVSFSPAPNATNVGLNAIPMATFNKKIDPTTVAASTVKLTYGNGIQVSGTPSVSGMNVSFTPSALLSASTTYTMTMSSLKFEDGKELLTQVSWSFTTGTTTGGSTTSGPNGATVIDPKGVVAFAWQDSTTLIVWVKKGANVNAPKPFIIGTFNNWLKTALPPFDANGWSSTTITITQPTTIAFSYGYDYGSGLGVLPNGSEIWASDMIQLSSYYKATPNNLQALAANNTVTPVP